jgi:UDP-N-acetylglucosamine acyltransferase
VRAKSPLMIHATAMVHPEAQLGIGVEIGAYAMVGAGARIGDRCRLNAHAIVHAGAEVGEGVLVDSFAVVAGEAQMRVPDPNVESGRVVVGARTVIREGVTIHRPTKAANVTEVGPDCFLMAHSHVAHDCRVGAFVTLANNAMIAGHVLVGDHVFVGGGAGVHQFVRLGESSMIAGNAAISYDVPPFAVAADRNDIVGLNLIGLRRRNLGSEVLADLKRCFRAVFLGSGNLRSEAARALESGEVGMTPQGRQFLEFFAGGKRGFGHSRRRRRGGGELVVD